VRYVGGVRTRRTPAALVAILAAVGGLSALGATVAAADSLGPVQWAFTGQGAPSTSKAGITLSWFRGNGTWNGGAAHGTIYADDSGGGAPKSRITLRVSGASVLSPGITRYGYKGIALALPVTVTKTDDASCAKGATGTISLFASYYGTHYDRMKAHFAAACSDHDLTFASPPSLATPLLRLEIQRNGAQVNVA
jgi:hypothetical protein